MNDTNNNIKSIVCFVQGLVGGLEGFHLDLPRDRGSGVEGRDSATPLAPSLLQITFSSLTGFMYLNSPQHTDIYTLQYTQPYLMFWLSSMIIIFSLLDFRMKIR